MVVTSKKNTIITQLYNSYKLKGFILEEEALNLFAAHNVSLVEIDILLDKLLSMGIIFGEPDVIESEESVDRAKIDYEIIYQEIINISPNEKHLVDYIRSTTPPQNREWLILIPQAQNGNGYAINRLFDMYLRLVLKIALKYYKKGLIDIDDAIQEGALGLMKGIHSFNPNKHKSPASYIPLWIKQHIDRYIKTTGRTIRIPVHMLEKIDIFERTIKSFSLRNKRKPTLEEIANIMNLTLDKVKSYRQYSQKTLSLDQFLGPNSETTLKDIIIDEDTLSPIEIVSRAQLQKNVLDVLNTLKPKEKKVICLRIGLLGYQEKTLEEIGELYNLTRERIRQIESKALLKISHPSRIKNLNDWNTSTDTNPVS